MPKEIALGKEFQIRSNRIIKGLANGLSYETICGTLGIDLPAFKYTMRHHRLRRGIMHTNATLITRHALINDLITPADIVLPGDPFTLMTASEAAQPAAQKADVGTVLMLINRMDAEHSEIIGKVSLSPVHMRIIGGILAGHTNIVVARQADCSPEQIKSTIHRLGLCSRSQLPIQLESGTIAIDGGFDTPPVGADIGEYALPTEDRFAVINRRPYAIDSRLHGARVTPIGLEPFTGTLLANSNPYSLEL